MHYAAPFFLLLCTSCSNQADGYNKSTPVENGTNHSQNETQATLAETHPTTSETIVVSGVAKDTRDCKPSCDTSKTPPTIETQQRELRVEQRVIKDDLVEIKEDLERLRRQRQEKRRAKLGVN